MDLRKLFPILLLILPWPAWGQPLPPPPQAQAEPVLIGTVVDETGRPLSGAEIRVSRQDQPAEVALADERRVKTAENGTFRVPRLVAGATYYVVSTLQGHASALTTVTIPKGSQAGQAQPRPVVMKLRQGRAAIGLVVDGKGLPVAGARVELVRSQTGRTTAENAPPLAEDGLYQGTTEEDGQLTIPHLPTGWFDLRVEGEGFAPLERSGVEIPEGQGAFDLGRLVVERGAVLTGRVSDPRGRPVPDAEVWLVPRSPRDWQSYYKKGPAAVSGREGDFVIANLPPRGEVSLDVCRKGFLPASIPVREISAEPVDAVLEPAARLAGRVSDPRGAPLSGARILAWLSGESPDKPASVRPCRLNNGATVADADGRFVLESLPPGWWTVRAEAIGWLSAESPRRQVLAGESLEGIELVLREGAVVAGRVFSPEGTPLAGAEVRTYGELSNPRAVTAGDGTYRLTGVEVGERDIEATHPDHEFASSALLVNPGENQLDLKLRPDPRSEIRGRVVGPDGRLVGGARVVTTGESATYSAADGSFSLLERNGTYEVWADRDGYAPGRAAETVTVAGRPVEGVQVRLAAGGVVTGRLLGLDLEKLRGARVEIDLQPPFQGIATVDPLGIYRLVEVPPGEWTVTATAGERSVKGQVALPPGSDEVVLDLAFPETWEVTGQVVGPYGEPVADALIRLGGGQGSPGGWTYSRSDGSFRLELEDGTYRVWVVRRNSFRAVHEEPIVVEGGPVSGVELRLGEEIVLRGLIHGLEPGERAKSVWAEGPHGVVRQGELDQESGFVVYGLGPGEWKITATFGDRQASGRVEVEEGKTEVGVEVEFEPHRR